MGLFSNKSKKIRKTPAGKLSRILGDFGVDLVLDVGANIGQTHDELRCAGYSGRIVSFEPVPNANTAIAGKSQSDPLWDIAPRAAVGAEVGEVTINVSEDTDMSSVLEPTPELMETLPKSKVMEAVKTPVITIDSIWDAYCSEASKVFLKVDTQGFERQVLDGAAETIDRLVGIQLELSLFPLYEGEETYLTYLNDMHAWGFQPYMIWENYFSRKLGRQMQIDVVFMRTEAKGGH